MNQELAIQLIQQALILTMWLCLPLLGILFIVGVVISLLQTLTSIQDPSFGAVPRLAALFVALLLVLPWILMRLITYSERLLADLSKYAR
ncbi:MAG TPA: flagellar biosynthetic protein FliQ [Bryobacteraceae bacterium]|jgi:flagellar biosynthetic protein FliQ|nr:flagellar biosynthetic protein FliQ [Bryobacteraceae bacterium]